jgi:uncharacterized repeat protein (TIGR03803 family)
MKMLFIVRRLIPLVTTLCLTVADSRAARVSILHDFTSQNSDSEAPTLILADTTFYGTTSAGGSTGNGTVFRINADGTCFTNLHEFTSALPPYTNYDGAQPYGALVLSADTLYGTASAGGNAGNGTVFRINTNGNCFTVIYSFTAAAGPYFTNSDGARPRAGLVLSGETLFGTTSVRGSLNYGTIFKVNTNGTCFTNLHNFTGADGYFPDAALALSGTTLYGTTLWNGAYGNGTVFKVNTDGSCFTNIHSFTQFSASWPHTNSDGGGPTGSVIVDGTMLYGTTGNGGAGGSGTVFKMNVDGTDFTTLYAFGDPNAGGPGAGLILSGTTLYGTADGSGTNGDGSLFSMTTDGTNFTTIYAFSGSDGNTPGASLILSGTMLYGTTAYGGSAGDGVIFALTICPALEVQTIGNAVVLTWNDPAFSLQAAPMLTDLFTNVPGAVSPYTNTLAGSQVFFRLKSN